MKTSVKGLGFLLHDAARLLRKRFEAHSGLDGPSAAQWRLLAQLLHQGPATQARIAALLEIEPISVSRLIDRMVDAGWVERRPDPNDRRVRIVHVTPKTVALASEFKGMAERVYGEALSGVAEADQEVLMRGLRSIIANLSDDDLDLAPCRAEEGAS